MILRLIWHVFFMAMGIIGVVIFNSMWLAQLFFGFIMFIEFGKLLENLTKYELHKIEKKLLE